MTPVARLLVSLENIFAADDECQREKSRYHHRLKKKKMPVYPAGATPMQDRKYARRKQYNEQGLSQVDPVDEESHRHRDPNSAEPR